MIRFSACDFVNIVEVVPPAGPDAGPVLDALEPLAKLPIDAFSVASNPVAKPRMSAVALAALIQERTGVATIVHCTTRDHNRLGAWSLLCGAKALGIETVLVATGDFVALGDRASTTTVRDVDVCSLVRMAREVGLQTGVVFDPHPESAGFDRQVDRLRQKAQAGAEFVVTQPVYDEDGVARIAQGLVTVDLPVVLGILPLRSARHATFLHDQVSGIAIPERVRRQLVEAEDPTVVGLSNALEVIRCARGRVAGVCIMPPFGHYQIASGLLAPDRRLSTENHRGVAKP